MNNNNEFPDYDLLSKGLKTVFENSDLPKMREKIRELQDEIKLQGKLIERLEKEKQQLYQDNYFYNRFRR